MAPPFTVPCVGREAQVLHSSRNRTPGCRHTSSTIYSFMHHKQKRYFPPV